MVQHMDLFGNCNTIPEFPMLWIWLKNHKIVYLHAQYIVCISSVFMINPVLDEL